MKTVIMAGGSGSRLWPSSRSLYPKQFLPLVEEKTMLQATIERVESVTDRAPLIICNEEHRFIAAEQVRELGKTADILLEPIGRNTAPAVALAALHALKDEDDPLLLVLAADHVIQNNQVFLEQIDKAMNLAEKGLMVTFGIVPASPETGYGYIRCGENLESGYRVSQFVEKPDYETAKLYHENGGYLWNSGMFVFKASRYLEELNKFRPDIVKACELSIATPEFDLDFIRINKEAFSKCPSESIDYAVMENTTDAVVIPMDCDWNDVGVWSSLWEVSKKDDTGNVVRGDVALIDTKDSFLHSSSRLVATVGMQNCIVVETPDAVLVAEKNRVQDVKKIVEQLEHDGRVESQLHREVYRPWGKYDSIDSGGRYQVKRITVEPGKKLSVQMHHHRAEHWVVVSGTALVRRGDEQWLLSENESVYIPVGEVHSLENPGKIPLEVIEVQSGTYLGEDDIVRFEDLYGREDS